LTGYLIHSQHDVLLQSQKQGFVEGLMCIFADPSPGMAGSSCEFGSPECQVSRPIYFQMGDETTVFGIYRPRVKIVYRRFPTSVAVGWETGVLKIDLQEFNTDSLLGDNKK